METALWMLGRGTGIVSLVLLTVSLCLGIVVRSRTTFAGLPRYGVTDVHKTASLTATGLIAVHVLTLLLDPQAGLKLVDLVVPFAGSYRPFWLGFGTLGLELVALVAISGLLRKRIGERAFRAIHLTSYGLWPTAVAHGLGTGSDAGQIWMLLLTGLCVAAVVGFGLWRLSEDFSGPGRARPATSAVPPAASPRS